MFGNLSFFVAVWENCTKNYREEINRHSQVRRVGTYSRKPLFDVWDWNYIVFNIRGNCTMGYEMYNGQLQMYWA